MYLSAATLDDLLRKVILKLLATKNRISVTRGHATELAGVLLQLTNPRARLSRTERKGHVFSALGELLWYLAKTNSLEFIRYYVQKYEQETEDGVTVRGAYGPRLFRSGGKHDQITNVLSRFTSTWTKCLRQEGRLLSA
jgi:thymidylate synthase